LSLAPEIRRAVERYVRPLYAGLDGEQTFHRVERVRTRVERIRGDEDLDPQVLELLVICHGAIARLGSMGRGGRLALFFGSLELDPQVSLRVRAGLDRLERSPRAPEELVVHDAMLLEEVGIAAVTRRLLYFGRRRIPLERALERLDPGPPPERFRTTGGRDLACRRRERAAAWIEQLRRGVESEEGLG
jgi:hypothetical protein